VLAGLAQGGKVAPLLEAAIDEVSRRARAAGGAQKSAAHQETPMQHTHFWERALRPPA